jgi:hypothetical protein
MEMAVNNEFCCVLFGFDDKIQILEPQHLAEFMPNKLYMTNGRAGKCVASKLFRGTL